MSSTPQKTNIPNKTETTSQVKDPIAVQSALLKKISLQNEAIISLLSKIHTSLQGVEAVPVQKSPKPKAKSKKQYTYVPPQAIKEISAAKSVEAVTKVLPPEVKRKTIKKTTPVAHTTIKKSEKAIIINDENNLGEENPFIFS